MKSMHISLVKGSLFFLLFVICSCESSEVNSDITVLPQQQANNDLKKLEDISNSKRGKILEGEYSDWKSTKILIGKEKSISAINFINERVGWACNKNNIFKTDDSGKTWHSFKIDFVGKGEIAFFQFTDDLQGWLIIEDLSKDDYSKNDRIRIYRTLDSGRSWKLTHSEMSVHFRDARFFNENGWLIAMKFVGDEASERSPLVLHFSNQSNNWTDVSEPVKKLSYDSTYAEGDLPTLDNLTIRKNNCVIAVNKPGKIFQSCDEGKSWQILYNVGNFPSVSSYGPQQIDSQDNFIWMIESGVGDSILTIIPINENSKKKLLTLPNYVREGFAVSESKIFLIGTTNDTLCKGLTNKGVIFQTTDSGETWKKILLIPQKIKSAQFFPSQKTIWILTENGELNRVSSENRHLDS